MIKRIFFSVIFFSCVFCFSTAEADLQKEEILSYHIDATLNQDSSVLVQETIKVKLYNLINQHREVIDVLSEQ